ncbi:MAG: peptidyl-prolyl cis-trans isomerase [Bacteroidetes bacterium]|nr:peptidyl-prolyl cis-trans isomerase [Bacteroidota bacterium]
MTKKICSLFVLFFFAFSFAHSQKEDPVLFSVAGKPVHLSEFEYIYTKTNGKQADFSRKSLDEYLDLYIKFKLKVQRARDMKLDTIPSLKQELAGYRRQLADSYLIDKEVTERLIREVYERSKKDVDISHILVGLSPNASPEDTLKAYKKAISVKQRLEQGADFGKVASASSSDRSVKNNKGHIGYVTALFPKGFYPLETAVYSSPIGEISAPIRTNSGYHILRVNDIRDARGEIEAAHILIRKKEGRKEAEIKTRIDSIYQVLQNGSDFDLLARELSEDKMTAPKGGHVGFFGINRFERAFEDTAFALENDQDYSQPFETSVGWHVIKRLSKREIQPYNIEKSRLEAKVKKDARFEEAKRAMIERIKEEGNFTVNQIVLEKLIRSLDKEFLSFKWKAPKEKSKEVLCSFGEEKLISVGEFTDYLGRASRQRIRMGKNTKIHDAVHSLFNNFVDESALKFEETQLEVKYPEFKSLMREYDEGILLFEATKMLVWDKASQDTTGLKAFFETIKGKYKWNERAVVSVYTLKEEAKEKIKKVRKYARKHSSEKMLAKFNKGEKKILSRKENNTEKGRNDVLDAMEWKAGSLSETEINKKNNSLNFMKIEEVLPGKDKALKEARGYIVADYQDFLEQKWVKELRKDYAVKTNRDVYESIVKD